MIKFIVTGLPRSGTSWLAAFLTTEDCVCLHDPVGEYTPEQLSNWTGGVSDTSLWFSPTWCHENTDKIIYIDRKKEEVNSSLNNHGLADIPEWMPIKFNENKHGFIVYFEDLFTEEICREIWDFVYPEKEFNVLRWKVLKGLHISPIYMEHTNE